MTREQIRRRFPQASESFIAANAGCDAGAARVPAAKSKPNPGQALEPIVPGEEEGGWRPGDRAYIEFHLYACQPGDWDNSHTKCLQDLLIEVGLLAGDEWFKLQGRVIPHPVRKKNEERTEVKIWYC